VGTAWSPWRPDSQVTLKTLLSEFWLPAQESRDLRPATISQYRLAVDHWIVPHIGGIKAVALTPAHVTTLVTTLRTTQSANGRNGLSARSAQVAVTVLKSAYKWAMENELIGRNPISGVRRPQVQAKAMKSWSVEEARAFLASTTSDRMAVAWALLLTRGLRRGEVCGLRWSAVNISENVLRIETTRVVVEGKPLESTPKTKAGRRSIPLDGSLIDLLRRHRVTQAAEKLEAGGAYADRGFVLADPLGRPYHPETISAWFDSAIDAADLPRIRLHDTRHTAASLMLASGCKPRSSANCSATPPPQSHWASTRM
jgi:integrase